MKSKGFTLIELMIVVAIIGILGAIAIPQYNNYVARTQVSEGLTVVRPLKVAIAEYNRVEGVEAANRELNHQLVRIVLSNLTESTPRHAPHRLPSIDYDDLLTGLTAELERDTGSHDAGTNNNDVGTGNRRTIRHHKL